MVGQRKRPYAVDKLYQQNLDQNVNGRKQAHGVAYKVASTSKRLQDGFSSKLSTKKKSAPAPAPHATRSAKAAADAVQLASSTKSVYDGMTPFTPGKKKGRKKKNETKITSSITPPPPSTAPTKSSTKVSASATTNNYRSGATTSVTPTTTPPVSTGESTNTNATIAQRTASRQIGAVQSSDERNDGARSFAE